MAFQFLSSSSNGQGQRSSLPCCAPCAAHIPALPARPARFQSQPCMHIYRRRCSYPPCSSFSCQTARCFSTPQGGREMVAEASSVGRTGSLWCMVVWTVSNGVGRCRRRPGLQPVALWIASAIARRWFVCICVLASSWCLLGGMNGRGGVLGDHKGLKGYGKGELQCPVCLCSCCCSCLLLLALTQNVRAPHHHNHPHGDHMTISTTTGTYVATRTTTSMNENNQDGGLWVAGALGVRRTARAGGARKWVVQWAC